MHMLDMHMLDMDMLDMDMLNMDMHIDMSMFMFHVHVPCMSTYHVRCTMCHVPCVMRCAACLCRAELVLLGGGLVDAVVEEGGEGEAARLLQRGVAVVELREDLAEVRQGVVVAHLRAVRCGTERRGGLVGTPREETSPRSRGETSPRCVGGVVGGALGRSAGHAAGATTCAAAPAPRARPCTLRSSAP